MPPEQLGFFLGQLGATCLAQRPLPSTFQAMLDELGVSCQNWLNRSAAEKVDRLQQRIFAPRGIQPTSVQLQGFVRTLDACTSSLTSTIYGGPLPIPTEVPVSVPAPSWWDGNGPLLAGGAILAGLVWYAATASIAARGDGRIINPKNFPTKAQIDRLVKDYAIMALSKRQGAPRKTQERLHNRFYKTLNNMIDKYPDVDMTSDRFMSDLSRHGEKYLSGRISGAAKDW